LGKIILFSLKLREKYCSKNPVTDSLFPSTKIS
jgi:hypothetical protein